MKNKSTPFIALGIAFIAIGFGNRPAFIAIGAAFLVIGLLFKRREKQGSE